MTVTYPPPRQGAPLALVPLLAAAYWMAAASGLWGFPIGALLLAGAVIIWAVPGDPRGPALAALGGLLALPAGLIWLIAGGFGPGLVALATAALSVLAAGRCGVAGQPRTEGAPPPRPDFRLDAKAALDEGMLGYFILGGRLPGGAEATEACEQAAVLDAALQAQGAYDDPQSLFGAVAAPESVDRSTGRIYGFDYELLRFPSAFLADEGLPGGVVWNRLDANREVALRVLRQGEPGRPWLLGIHGYRMGVPWMDLGLFGPRWLHERLGLNLVLPVLPLHGPRKIGLRSGDFYLDGDPLDLFHAQLQAVSDLRQTVAWIRQQEPEARIGVYGVSLGGYNAALLSNLEAGLAFAVAAIPVVDFAAALWRVMPPAHQHYFEQEGLSEALYRRLLSPVSPLRLPTQLAPDRRHVIGAVADRIVPASHPLALARHWGVDVQWYEGSHLTVRRERLTREAVEAAMVTAGWPLPPA
jgi:hypothetical protein